MHAHRNKQRALRELKQGKRSFLTPAFVKRYDWTHEEQAFIQPFIRDIQRTCPEASDQISLEEVSKIIDAHTKRPATASTYKSRATALMRLFEIDNGAFSDILLNHGDDHIIRTIKQAYPSAISYFAFLLWLRDHSDRTAGIMTEQRAQLYKEQFDLEKDKNSVRLVEARSSDKSYSNIYESIFRTERSLRETQYGDMDHLIATMYTTALYDQYGVIHMNPRNYFYQVRLIRDDLDLNIRGNFLNVVTGRMLINDFKTAGIYKPYDLKLSPDVLRVIESSLAQTPREYLIVTSRGEVYTPSGMSEKVVRVLGYNIDTIRKAIESYEINTKKTDRLHMAFVSRHSVATQDISYVARD